MPPLHGLPVAYVVRVAEDTVQVVFIEWHGLIFIYEPDFTHLELSIMAGSAISEQTTAVCRPWDWAAPSRRHDPSLVDCSRSGVDFCCSQNDAADAEVLAAADAEMGDRGLWLSPSCGVCSCLLFQHEMKAQSRGAVQVLQRHGLPVGEVAAIVAGCLLGIVLQRRSHRESSQAHGGAQGQVRL